MNPSICYIIKEWFFYFNYFSLIIFYYSVWLGFKLFGLRVQMCSQLVQFTLTCKGYNNHHCHNKPQTENGAGVWTTSCLEEMGWEFGRFWKKIQLRSDHGIEKLKCDHGVEKLGSDYAVEDLRLDHAGRQLGLPLGHRELSSLPLQRRLCFSKMNWDLKHHKICRTLGGVVSIVWLWKTFKNYVSLLMSKNRSQKLIKPFVPEQQSLPVFLHMYMYCCYYYDYGYGYTIYSPSCYR